MTRHFWKYQAAGNDFVVVEGPPLPTAEEARRLCDRRRGIGADGVLTVLPPRADGVAFMHVHNADGSVAEMCGNGIRCVARHLAERRELPGDLLVETQSGTKRCTVHRDARGRCEAVTVDMGTARLEGEQVFELGPERLEAMRVSMGNPHAVIFDGAGRPRAEQAGPAIERLVPGGVNVGFARAHAGGLDLLVWERGAGLTEACGTGACAAAVAAVRSGRVPGGGPVAVRLPGGVLEVTVGADLSVRMKGPAERVFEGETSL